MDYPNTDSQDVTRASNESTTSPARVVVSGKKIPQYVKGNVLNSYRSYTYNFTMAALSRESLADPSSYRDKDLDFVILKSGGKGSAGMTANQAAGVEVKTSFRAEGDSRSYDVTKIDTQLGKDLVAGFNKESAGRFDMFIEDIEIETLMTFTPGTNTSLHTGLKFNVFEPYSISGFIEALRTSAVACGYPSYIGASYLLKMQFAGYPDDEELSDPVKEIQYATRYFIFKFAGLDVEVTEKGTRYQCKAIPYHEGGFGLTNKLKEPIQMNGNTVKEILENFIDNVNRQVTKIDQEHKPREHSTKHDRYFIKFSDIDEAGEINFPKDGNEIAKSKVTELLRENSLYKFPDYGKEQEVADNGQRANGTDKGSVKYFPTKTVVQFSENSNIHECIVAVIRDSKYVRDILKNVSEKIDSNGFIDYFIVNIEVEPESIDPVSKKNFQKITYIVSPYKLHYTRIPNFGSQKIDGSKLESLAIRKYNYIYAGNNSDLLNFKLNFNTLFFEALPKSMGNSDYYLARNALGKVGDREVIVKPEDIQNIQLDQNPTPYNSSDPKSFQSPNIGYGGAAKMDAYSIMARQMHEAIINPKGSMLTGELEILGDPIYLVTAGMGNYRPKFQASNVTIDGEVSYTRQEVLINLIFKNPTDIGSDGFLQFDQNKVPFSGVYRVNKVKSYFKDGVFKQILEVMRIPGQIVGQPGIKETNPKDKLETKPNPVDTPVRDITKAVSQPADPCIGINVFSQLSGVIAQLGGIGGAITDSVQGLAGQIQNVTSGISRDLANGINAALNPLQVGLAQASGAINSLADGVAGGLTNLTGKLCLSPSLLSEASALQLTQMNKLGQTLPDNVNPKASANQGVAVNLIPVVKYANLPPVAPVVQAPPPESNAADLVNIMKAGGLVALANAYGVSDATKISSSILPRDTQQLLSPFISKNITNPLASNNISEADSTQNSQRTLTQLGKVSDSVEVNLRIANGNINSDLLQAITTVNKSKIESPLSRLYNAG